MGRGVPALRSPAPASPRSEGPCNPACHGVPGVGKAMVGQLLSVAVQRAVASTALGVWTMPALPSSPDGVPLDDVLELFDFAGPSRLPLR